MTKITKDAIKEYIADKKRMITNPYSIKNDKYIIKKDKYTPKNYSQKSNSPSTWFG